MEDFMKRLPTMYKAVAAFISLVIPFLTAVAAALSDGTVTTSEWVVLLTAGGALVGGTKAVYEIRNRKEAK
jgi:hypothetical protein